MSPSIEIPENELRLTFSRSSGSGGQNVNKVATRVTLHWRYLESAALSPAQKDRVGRSSEIARRINSEGEIVLHEERERRQGDNRRRILEKLHDLVRRALAPRRRRIPTRPPASVQRNRLKNKNQRSLRKKERRWRPGDDS